MLMPFGFRELTFTKTNAILCICALLYYMYVVGLYCACGMHEKQLIIHIQYLADSGTFLCK